VVVGGEATKVTRYLVNLQLGGLTGVDRFVNRQGAPGRALLARSRRGAGRSRGSRARCT